MVEETMYPVKNNLDGLAAIHGEAVMASLL
jgi:hypothetical protein